MDPIVQERQSQWGDPVETHERIAAVWTGVLNHEVTATEVALCMAGLKLVRSNINPADPDSYVDARGYVQIAGLIEGTSQ